MHPPDATGAAGETGWFVPPDPEKNAGPLPKDLVTQTEDVLVDTRGYVYVTAKNWGAWILRYRRPDQPAPTDRCGDWRALLAALELVRRI